MTTGRDFNNILNAGTRSDVLPGGRSIGDDAAGGIIADSDGIEVHEKTAAIDGEGRVGDGRKTETISIPRKHSNAFVHARSWLSNGRRGFRSDKFKPANVKGALQKYIRFVGPGFMIAVSYMDPGNYATDVCMTAD